MAKRFAGIGLSAAMVFATVAVLEAPVFAAPQDPAALEIITTRKTEIDLSGDGKPDFFRDYDPSGVLRRFRIDGDADGRIDYEEEREGVRSGAREDSNSDGNFDRWVALWLDDPQGDYRRQEWIDSDHDGNVDLWVIEETSLDGESVYREESRDSNKDGQPDVFERTFRARWLGQPVPSAPPGSPIASSVPPGLTPAERGIVTAGCGMPSSASPSAILSHLLPDLRRVVRSVRKRMPAAPNWRRTPFGPQIDLTSCGPRAPIIEAALRGSVVNGLGCLAQYNRKLMCRYAVFLAEQMPEIRCSNEQSFEHPEEPLPEAQLGGTTGTDACAIGAAPGREVWLSQSAFTTACGGLDATLFHEFLHNFGVGTAGLHSHVNPADGVYGCERLCFPPPGGPGLPPPGPACRFAR